MSFYEKMDEIIDELPQCEIILDDEFVSEPEPCPNKVFKICSKCGKKICYYHSEKGHKEDLR